IMPRNVAWQHPGIGCLDLTRDEADAHPRHRPHAKALQHMDMGVPAADQDQILGDHLTPLHPPTMPEPHPEDERRGASGCLPHPAMLRAKLTIRRPASSRRDSGAVSAMRRWPTALGPNPSQGSRATFSRSSKACANSWELSPVSRTSNRTNMPPSGG